MKYIIYLICQILMINPTIANTINITGSIIEYSCNIESQDLVNKCLLKNNTKSNEKFETKKLISKTTTNNIVTVTYY